MEKATKLNRTKIEIALMYTSGKVPKTTSRFPFLHLKTYVLYTTEYKPNSIPLSIKLN